MSVQTVPNRSGGRPNKVAGPGLISLGLRQGATEIKQFMRSKEQVVFTLLFPLMLMLIFGSIFTWEISPGVKFTQYFVTGMIASGLMSTGFQALAIQIPIERDRGVLKRFRGTPMRPAIYFIGKVQMVLLVAVLETILLLAVAVGFYGVSLPDSTSAWLTLLWVGLLGIIACTLSGIAFSSVPRTGRSAPAVVTPIALILQFISGVFFVFTQLPSGMQHVAALFPLKWMCQGMRSVFLPSSFASQEAAGSWELGKVAVVLVLWCVGALVACLLTFRWTTKRDG